MKSLHQVETKILDYNQYEKSLVATLMHLLLLIQVLGLLSIPQQGWMIEASHVLQLVKATINQREKEMEKSGSFSLKHGVVESICTLLNCI